jgi:hypothetical protein
MNQPTSISFRALCAELVNELHDYKVANEQHDDALVYRARAALAEPEPEGPTDEQWDAIKDRLWSQYETRGYQGERFIYQGDFDTAMDVARQELTRYARPTTKPVPVAERLPGPEDCDAEGRCWIGMWNEIDGEQIPDWELSTPAHYTWKGIAAISCWLPHHALPLPTP